MSSDVMCTTVGRELRRALAEAGVSQYWLAQRARVGAVTVCRIINDIRHPTEAQLLHLCCGLLCTGSDYASYLDVMYASDEQVANKIAKVLAAKSLGVGDVARRSHVGRVSVERFLRHEILLDPAKVMRIFAAAVFEGARLARVNHLLEVAGYYVIGESDDDRRTA